MAGFSIIEFLQKQGTEWQNANGVFFMSMPTPNKKPGVIIIASYPGFDRLSTGHLLDIAAEFENEVHLYQHFPFNSLDEVLQFDIPSLLAAYLQGIANIICYVDVSTGKTLEFKMMGKTMMAVNPDTHKFHPVEQEMKEPNDFIKYTLTYFAGN